MTRKVVEISKFRKPVAAPEEQHYEKAMTVQQLMDRLGFCDRKAKVYVRNSWMAGVVETIEYTKGVCNKPTLLLFMNQEELPK